MAALSENLDHVIQDIGGELKDQTHAAHITTVAIISFTGLFSIGWVIWIFRSGSLLASFLFTLPVWKAFDPLPILEYHDRKAKKRAKAGTKTDPVDPDEDIKSLLS